MEISDTIKKNFSNPFIWVSIAAGLLTVLNSYNQIDSNTIYTSTVEDRQTKKIGVQNELIEEVKSLNIKLLLLEKEIEHEHEIMALEREILELKLKHYGIID